MDTHLPAWLGFALYGETVVGLSVACALGVYAVGLLRRGSNRRGGPLLLASWLAILVTFLAGVAIAEPFAPRTAGDHETERHDGPSPGNPSLPPGRLPSQGI